MQAAVDSRRLDRRPGRARLGGVATGIAAHLRIRVLVVRVLFVVLAGASGFGLALYAVFWIVLPKAADAPTSRRRIWFDYAVGFVAAAGAVSVVGFSVPLGGVFAPLILAGLGGALIWRQATETDRDRWRRLSRSSLSAGGGDRLGRLRTLAGAVLVIVGGVLVLAKADVSAIRDGLLATVVAVVGIALLTGPWWMRLIAQLGSERSERIRSQERADIAAHLHDSVMQTLALIQRNAGSPREVARLARGQERELRQLLYGPREPSGQLAGELAAAAAEVEDAYAVTVDTVVVGDAPLDERLAAAGAAAREAMVNAAKHSEASTISLYVEVEPEVVSVFVRDRGVGFDLDSVDEDRQGVRGSIIGRVERHGGTVRIRSQVGTGTEVEITMPRVGP